METGSCCRMGGSPKGLSNFDTRSIANWRRCICWGLVRQRMRCRRRRGMRGGESLIRMGVTTTSGHRSYGLISIPLRGLIFAGGERAGERRWTGLRTAAWPRGRIASGATRTWRRSFPVIRRRSGGLRVLQVRRAMRRGVDRRSTERSMGAWCRARRVGR